MPSAMLRLWPVVFAVLLDTSLCADDLPPLETKQRSGSALLQETQAVAEPYVTITPKSTEPNPVAAVVKLLQAMSKTLKEEYDEDEKQQYDITCWCTNSKNKKTETMDACTERISELRSKVESFTAKKTQLEISIEDLVKLKAEYKQSLAEATEIRNSQKKKFDQYEEETTTYIRSLFRALTVLDDKIGLPALPQVAQFGSLVSLLAQPSLLQLDASSDQESADASAKSLDDFMRDHGFTTSSDESQQPKKLRPVHELVLEQQREKEEAIASEQTKSSSGFLGRRAVSDGLSLVEAHRSAVMQTATSGQDASTWSASDKASIQAGLSTALAFMQSSRGRDVRMNTPGSPRELIGMLKQMKETMQADLEEATATEKGLAKEYDQMKLLKLEEIEACENQIVRKRDDHAQVCEEIGIAKAEIRQQSKVLKETREALAAVEKSCMEAKKSYDQRQKARGLERQSVAEALEALSGEETSNAFSFLQESKSSDQAEHLTQFLSERLGEARRAELAQAMAASTQADSFTKLKETIDNMTDDMKQQQETDNKKRDWCKQELFENGRDTEKAAHDQSSEEVKVAQIKTDSADTEVKLNETAGKKDELGTELQQASLDRKKEHEAFLRTIRDQEMTLRALKKAKAKLSIVYEQNGEASASRASATLVQIEEDPVPVATDAWGRPIKTKSYAKNGMGGSIMTLLQSLMDEASELIADASKSENEAQAAYGELVARTKRNVEAFEDEMTEQSVALARAKKRLSRISNNIKSLVGDQQDLTKQKSNLKSECDFLLKNFDTIRQARTKEMEALKQAKFVLSGATIEAGGSRTREGARFE
eukprot:TRINITY_DN75645_c0_g1_i1.p1 TRINITY_DN75645_c0_g1~~TRINITY_DN75645_c0_g1_i1.p1  ORF type:complete len:826 (-),score=206.27 TRINITY_DN75645_c0_g1_i1:230-2707(-)